MKFSNTDDKPCFDSWHAYNQYWAVFKAYFSNTQIFARIGSKGNIGTNDTRRLNAHTYLCQLLKLLLLPATPAAPVDATTNIGFTAAQKMRVKTVG